MERIIKSISREDATNIVKVVITPDEHKKLKCDPKINFVRFPPEGQGEAVKHVAYGTISGNQTSQLEDALDNCQ
jgi:hypothetical protein